MGWYGLGSIACSGKTVTGTGTKWKDNKLGIGAGQALLIPGSGTVKIYEIKNVDSDTKITLVSSPGTIAAGQAYAIMSFYTDSVPDFARRLSAQLSYYQSQMDGWQQILTGTGDITLTAPDNTTVVISSMSKLTNWVTDLQSLGIGLPTQTSISNFDWKTFAFTSGANYLAYSVSWLNAPAEIVYPAAGLVISIKVDYVSGTTAGLTLIPSTITSSNFNVYKIRVSGAAGSRTFTVRQDWNSANPIPITGGGTGSTTLVGAQSALGIVPQLITTLYPGGSAGSPPSIGINQRIDVANPFPGRNINFRVEILSGGIWGDPGFGSNIGSGSNSFGVVARDYNGAITIVSGVTAVGIYSNMIGNGFNSSAGITTAQYRVIVWTIV